MMSIQENTAELRALLDQAENLPNAVEVVQTTGDSETKVMSQKAVTEALETVGSWNNLTDKPFDSEFVSEEVFSADRLDFSPTGSGAAIYEMYDLLNLVPGRVYTVSWAGEEFQCEAKAYEDAEMGETGVALGECGEVVPLAPAGNGEPFGIATIQAPDFSYTLTKFISHNGSYSGPVRIWFEGEVATKHLDEMFLPDSLFEEAIPEAVESALTEAKKSGEFDGYSPVRGTDYWTEADKAEIKSYVDEAILGGAW